MPALKGLTVRGRCFLAAGIAAALAAVLLGQNNLLRIALLLIILPLLSMYAVHRTRYLLVCERTITPDRVPAGTNVQVTLRVTNASRLPTGVLLLEDHVPYALGSRPRFVLDRLWPKQSASVEYSVRGDVRGRYHLGPLQALITDPFGLYTAQKSFTGTDQLVVVPAVVKLPSVKLAGQRYGSGDNRSRSVAVHGEDDSTTREYRRGDDLRKVHWLSTARTGELMVRLEEQPWQSKAGLLLDTRSRGHRGDGPGSSFEWAVSATASLGAHLVRSGYHLRMVTDAGAQVQVTPGRDGGSASELLGLLSDVRQSHHRHLTQSVQALRKLGPDGIIVAVLGVLSDEAIAEIAGLRAGGRTCVAILVDANSWIRLGPEERDEATQRYEYTAKTLTAGGWRVVPAHHGARLPELWRQARSGGSTTAPAAGRGRTPRASGRARPRTAESSPPVVGQPAAGTGEPGMTS